LGGEHCPPPPPGENGTKKRATSVARCNEGRRTIRMCGWRTVPVLNG
jgi:hypothetical protein